MNDWLRRPTPCSNLSFGNRKKKFELIPPRWCDICHLSHLGSKLTLLILEHLILNLTVIMYMFYSANDILTWHQKFWGLARVLGDILLELWRWKMVQVDRQRIQWADDLSLCGPHNCGAWASISLLFLVGSRSHVAQGFFLWIALCSMLSLFFVYAYPI